MTGAAGFSLLHLGHGIFFSLSAGGKDFVVAVITLVNPDMGGMAENDFAGIRQVKNDVCYTVMTSVTATRNTEGNICVMTGTAGTVILHISHGISATPLATGKDAAMTVGAVIHLFYWVSMNFMTEKCRNLLKADIR